MDPSETEDKIHVIHPQFAVLTLERFGTFFEVVCQFPHGPDFIRQPFNVSPFVFWNPEPGPFDKGFFQQEVCGNGRGVPLHGFVIAQHFDQLFFGVKVGVLPKLVHLNSVFNVIAAVFQHFFLFFCCQRAVQVKGHV